MRPQTVLEDPPEDPDHPAMLVPLTIESGTDQLLGMCYVPTGPGPHPAVLLLHGLPGYERNLDLAQAYRRAGWASFLFHYRGAWGSSRIFTFEHVLQDAYTMLRNATSAEVSDRCRVDPSRVVPIGHSMGGWAALMLASENDVLGAAPSPATTSALSAI